MRSALSLLLLGAGALALAWGAHDLAQVFVEVGSCSTDGNPRYCPPGIGLSIVVTLIGAVTMVAGAYAGTSARTNALMIGLLSLSLGAAVLWSQLGPSAQPGDPSLIALGLGAFGLLVGMPSLYAANGTALPALGPGGGGGDSGGGFWSFGDSDSGGDSGCSSGCGGGCGGGD